ncbi:hypothetical protein [Fibrisoma limi]|nr:hypothetical protein [Fibrisoma limi]
MGARTTLIESIKEVSPFQAQLANAIASTPYGKTYEPCIGYEIGIANLYRLGRFHFQPELIYALNKTYLIKTNYSTMNDARFLLSNHTIELDLLLREYISKKIYILVGPYIQIKFRSTMGKGKDLTISKIVNDDLVGYGIKGGIGITTKYIDIQLNNQYSKAIFASGNLLNSGHVPSLSIIWWYDKGNSN